MLQADSCLRHLCTAPNTVDKVHSSLPWPRPSEPALEHVTAASLHLAPLGVLDVLQEVVLERQDQSGTNERPHGGQRGQAAPAWWAWSGGGRLWRKGYIADFSGCYLQYTDVCLHKHMSCTWRGTQQQHVSVHTPVQTSLQLP